MRPYFIGITGPSGAGKTTLAEALVLQLPDATVIRMDWYYLGLEHLDLGARRGSNFDDPSLLDAALLTSHMNSLSRGHYIELPIYSFERYARMAETINVLPSSFIIIEGIFALHFDELRALLNAKIFVTAPDEVCFQRRLDRDTRERGRTPESVIQQYDTTVRPGAQQFVLPTRAVADLVVRGDQPLNDSLSAALGFIETTATAFQI